MDLRVGIVSSVNLNNCTARVSFPDRANVVSNELPILVRGSLQNKDYWLPHPGEQVVCIFLPTGNAQGFVIGSIYSKKDAPPVANANKRHITFSDGTSVEYDSSTHTLTIDAKGIVKVIGNVTVTGDVIADEVSLKNHVHNGVQSGLGNTEKPVRS